MRKHIQELDCLAQDAIPAASFDSKKQTDLIKRRVIKSEELFQGMREILIEHINEQYRLLITKSGKLILNK